MHCCCPPKSGPFSGVSMAQRPGFLMWSSTSVTTQRLWPVTSSLPQPLTVSSLVYIEGAGQSSLVTHSAVTFPRYVKEERKKKGDKTPLVRYFGFKSPILKCNCILNSSWWFDNSFIGIGPFQAERGIVWIMKKNIFGFIRGSVSCPTLNV